MGGGDGGGGAEKGGRRDLAGAALWVLGTGLGLSLQYEPKPGRETWKGGRVEG